MAPAPGIWRSALALIVEATAVSPEGRISPQDLPVLRC
jgi:hypothetical protein